MEHHLEQMRLRACCTSCQLPHSAPHIAGCSLPSSTQSFWWVATPAGCFVGPRIGRQLPPAGLSSCCCCMCLPSLTRVSHVPPPAAPADRPSPAEGEPQQATLVTSTLLDLQAVAAPRTQMHVIAALRHLQAGKHVSKHVTHVRSASVTCRRATACWPCCWSTSACRWCFWRCARCPGCPPTPRSWWELARDDLRRACPCCISSCHATSRRVPA